MGYARLALLALAVVTGKQQQYYTSLYLLVFNFALDAVDGILARALQQVRNPPLSNVSEQGAVKHWNQHCKYAVKALIIGHLVSQESGFGAWLDVVVDNISRGAVWCWAVEGPLAAIPIALEFLTFASTQKVTSGIACIPAACKGKADRSQGILLHLCVPPLWTRSTAPSREGAVV